MVKPACGLKVLSAIVLTLSCCKRLHGMEITSYLVCATKSASDSRFRRPPTHLNDRLSPFQSKLSWTVAMGWAASGMKNGKKWRTIGKRRAN
eukprot:816788-Amphidinium_carterae.1